MTPDASPASEAPVGREREVDALTAFLGDLDRGPAAVVLEGEAGIGKTTLWRLGVDLAAGRGVRTLSVRPAEAESRLSFAGLGDLLDGADDLIERLPDPMRSALRVALLSEEAGEDPTDARAVDAATAGVLRAAGSDGPALIAIDDAQWLDRASASALAFALRRLADGPVGCLLSVRERGAALPLGIGRSLDASRVTRLAIPPLTRDQLAAAIRARIGTSLPRPILDRIAETSGGNPFFALEIAAAAVRGDQRATGQSLPIPRDLRDDLIRDRLGRLAASGREALLFAAASAHPTAELLGTAVGRPVEDQLAKAADAGLIAFDGGGVRFVHPLYGSAIYADASRDHRHRVHRRLSEVVRDPEARARHLALASDGPDPEAAAALEAAAEAAGARGASASAAELYDLAERLLPEDRGTDIRRLRIAAASERSRAGDPGTALRILEPLVAAANRGPERAAVLDLLGRIRAASGDLRGARTSYDAALGEAGVTELARGEILVGRSVVALVLGDLPGAERDAEEGLGAARSGVDEEATAWASVALASARAWQGRGVDRGPVDAVLEGEGSGQARWSVGRVRLGVADLLARAGPVEEARVLCGSWLDEATDAGDEAGAGILHRDLAWLALLAGSWDRAEEHLHRAVGSGPATASALGVRAILASLRGRDEAAAAARDASFEAERTGSLEAELFARSALGSAALSQGDAADALAQLAPAWDLHRSAGIEEPAMFPFVADLAEASIEVGEVDLARAIAGWLEERGRALDRPWALGAAARCRGLLASADGEPSHAIAELDDALRMHDTLGMPFEIARTLLCLGSALRRSKRKKASREALERASAMFDELGAPVWAARARAEEARIGGRRASPGELTEAEERVCRLAASGLTNREIADALYMSVRTVEGHLSRSYPKLGVRTRTELALHLQQREERSPGT